MKFTVQNLGRLAEATIDLDKDLILFVGPNNTSKTYVAHTLFGFYSKLASILIPIVSDGRFLEKRIQEKGSSWRVDFRDLLTRSNSELANAVEQRYHAELADVLASDEAFTQATRILLSVDYNTVKQFLTVERLDSHEFATGHRMQ